MPMCDWASLAALVAVAASTPSLRTSRRATSSTSGTRSRTVRTRERMVGIRSASLGAHRIQTVRGGGSSRALSSTLEVRSVIRSASSMTITRYRPNDGENWEFDTSRRTSSMEMITRSVLRTPRSGWVRASTCLRVASSCSGPGLRSAVAKA